MNLSSCIIDGLKTQKDGSVKITLITQELSPQQLAELIIGINKEVVSVELPEDTSERKSKSARLRDTLWHVWDKNHKAKFTTFELYYNHTMEQLIEMYKEKIDM